MMEEQLLTASTPHGRGCGKRQPRKLYITSGLSVGGGEPMEKFLVDPVIPWPYAIHRGAQVVDRGDGSGINDLVITVGREYDGRSAYPDPWSFASEADLYGASKAISPMVPFEQLTPRHWDEETQQMVGSRMLLLHGYAYPLFDHELSRYSPLAYCKVQDAYAAAMWECVTPGYHPVGAARPSMEEPSPCVQGMRDLAFFIHLQDETGMMVWWEDEPEDRLAPGTFRVDLPSASFRGRIPIHPAATTGERHQFTPGIFMALPISGFEFYKEANEEVKGRLEGLGFGVSVLDY